MNYTWEIISVNPSTRTMVVRYQSADGAFTITVNISMPIEGQTAQEVIERSVPVMQLQASPVLPALATVEAGATGSATWAPTPIVVTPIEDTIRTIVQQELAAQAAK